MSQWDLHTSVYSSVIHHSLDVEVAKVSTDEGMDKENLAHTWFSISLKKGKNSDTTTLDEPWGHCANGNKPVKERQTL